MFKDWLRRRAEGLLDNAIFAAIVAGGAAVWSWLTNLPGVIIAVIALMVFVLLLLAINQYALIRERHKERLTSLSDKQLENHIREWVDIPAFQFKRLDATSEVYFAFEITYGNSHIHVERQYKDPMVIVLAAELVMKPEVTFNEGNWKRLASKLSIEMARFGIQWNFCGDPNIWERLRVIETVTA